MQGDQPYYYSNDDTEYFEAVDVDAIDDFCLVKVGNILAYPVITNYGSRDADHSCWPPSRCACGQEWDWYCCNQYLVTVGFIFFQSSGSVDSTIDDVTRFVTKLQSDVRNMTVVDEYNVTKPIDSDLGVINTIFPTMSANALIRYYQQRGYEKLSGLVELRLSCSLPTE